MNDGFGVSGSKDPFQTNYVDPNVGVNDTNKTGVIDNAWSQDSLSTSSFFNPLGGQYSNNVGYPNLPKPDKDLVTTFDIRTFTKENIAKQDVNTPTEFVFKNPTETKLNEAYDGFFENIIAGKPNADALRAAHYSAPAGTPPTTPEEIEAFKMLQQQFPEMTLGDFVPKPDKSGFKTEVTLANDDEFAALLDKQAPPLTASEKATLKLLHFHPKAKFQGSNDPELKAQLKSLEGQAAAITAKKFSIPMNGDGTLSISLKADSSMYDASLNGHFQENLANGLATYLQENKMSVEDQNLLQKYVNDPSTPVSKEIAAAGDIIRNQAIGKVISMNHLEQVGFNPVAPGTFPPINPLSKAFVKQMDDVFGQMSVMVNSMQDGSSKTAMLNILKIISDALNEYKTTLYGGQGVTSAQAAAYSKAKLDIALNKIQENVDKMKEAAKKNDCISKMGIFGKIFKFIIMLVLLVVSWINFNPALAAVAIMGMIDAVAPEQEVFKKVFDGIAKFIEVIMPYLKGGALKAFQDIAKMGFILAAGGYAIATAFPDLMKGAHIIADIAMATGKSKEDAEALEGTALMVMGITITVVVMVLSIVLTLGAAAPGIFPEFMGAAIQAVAEVGAQLTASMGQWAAQAMAIANLAQGFVGLISSGLGIGQAVIKHDLAIMMGKLKASQALDDAEIQQMIKLIKKLLASLQGSAEAISFVTTTMNSVLKNQSEAVTNITNVQV